MAGVAGDRLGGDRGKEMAMANDPAFTESGRSIASRTAGLAAQTMSFGACLGARSVLGIAAAKNELRRRPRRSRGTRSQQNVKILRHFR